MNTLTRALAALAIGVTITAGAGVACTNEPKSVVDYAAEMREAMQPGEGDMIADDQLVAAGQAMCSQPELLNGTNEGPVEYTEITKRYCPVLTAAAPAMQSYPESDAGTAIESAAPQAVTLNQRFDILDQYGVKMADAAFTAIAVGADCSESKKYLSAESTPKRGHFVNISMDIATTPEFQANQVGYPTAYDFTFTGPDGYVDDAVDAPTAYCVPQDDTFSVMTPSNKYKGALTLDLKSTVGTLTYKPHFNQAWPGVTLAIPAA